MLATWKSEMQLTEFDYDVVVVGGGAVGLSAGYYCAEAGMNTVVVERHERFCEEASTHNSGVLHSGFNPEPGTLKSRLNIEGLSLMYRKSEEWKFRTKKVGTMVAATTKQEERRLLLLKADGERNGVTGLELLRLRVTTYPWALMPTWRRRSLCIWRMSRR